ncbi:MAG TPA: hypothetical protein VIP57_06980 [Candidatus Dormibacteraeota bacterium]
MGPVDLSLQRLEPGEAVFGDPIRLDVADLLQLAVEAEAEIVRWLLRPAAAPAANRAEIHVVLDNHVLEADARVLDFTSQADDIDQIRGDVLHGHQPSQVAG